MNDPLKIVFLGSPDFAKPTLAKLLEDDRFKVVAVITVPDKPAGRGQTLTPPPIKRFALEKGLEVWQPEKLKEIDERMRAAKPDFLVVVAYGKLVPKSILSIPKYGSVNIHGSILPRYRGAAVMQAPILNGDKETGVTIMLMDEGLDTGPILKIVEMPLHDQETVEELHDRLSVLGADSLPQALVDLAEGRINPKPQDGPSNYVKETKKDDGRIDWSKSAETIERMVRAYTPWPGTFTQTGGKDGKTKNLKILEVERETKATSGHSAGEVFLTDGKLAIQCGDRALVVTKLQIEGGKPLSSEDFLRGHKDFIGRILN